MNKSTKAGNGDDCSGANTREQDANTAQLSIGAQKLAELGSRRWVAKQLGVGSSTLAGVCSGARRASADLRARAQSRLGIDPEDFDKVADKPVEGASTIANNGRARPVRTRYQLEEQVRRLESLLDTHLSTSAQIQVEKALGQCLSSLCRLDGVHITEATVVRHPAHQRVMNVILDAIEPYPDVLKAVSEALESFEAMEDA